MELNYSLIFFLSEIEHKNKKVSSEFRSKLLILKIKFYHIF